MCIVCEGGRGWGATNVQLCHNGGHDCSYETFE